MRQSPILHGLTITKEIPTSLDVRQLIQLLDESQVHLYPAESNHLTPVERLCAETVTFLVARISGQAVGCGAYLIEPGYGEIKRMFVLSEFRGKGIGQRILVELEARMRAVGLTLVRLETGVRQPEALGLYASAGYRQRGPFGNYSEDPWSVFLEKSLQ